jgi:hypothetical protein
MQGVTGERPSFDTLVSDLMAGRGPAPDPQRVRRGKPARGDWTPAPDTGWQHDWPDPPSGLLPGSVEVWGTWLRSWFAVHWTPDDLPVLRLTIRLYDRVMRGDVKRLPELRQWLDSMGITLKGRQDRRWEPPRPKRTTTWRSSVDDDHPYAHLRFVGDGTSVDRERDPRFRRYATTPDEHGRWAVREVAGQERRRRSAKERLADIEAIEQGRPESTKERFQRVMAEEEQRRRLSVLER